MGVRDTRPLFLPHPPGAGGYRIFRRGSTGEWDRGQERAKLLPCCTILVQLSAPMRVWRDACDEEAVDEGTHAAELSLVLECVPTTQQGLLEVSKTQLRN